VVSASGLLDKSKTEGFNAGLHYLQLNANTFTSPPKYSPEADPNVIGIIEMSVDPAVEKTRYTPQTIDQIFSLIGGFVSLVMTGVGVVVGSY
jgi:hypothetical protein